MVEVGAEHGVSRKVLLRGSGVSAADLEDESTGIAADQEIAVIRNLLRHTGTPPALAVEVGRRYTLGNTGILGFALLTSPTTRAAISAALNYVGLTSTLLRYRLEEDGDEAALVMAASEIPEDVRTFVLTRDLTALLNSIFPATFGPLVDGRLDLALGRGDLQGLLELVPPTIGVRTGAARNAFVFPRARLDEPMPQADPYTARLCAVQCEELLQRRRQRAGTAHRTRVRLLRDHAAMPSAEQIADELGVDVRTLRRHLVAEGTSFQELRDEVREQLAVELLGDLGLSVTEVARRLGYAETSAFSHAFKRWRAVSPRTFQHQRTGSRGSAAPAR
jgi:AraC-like DNA-binding protein